MRFDVFSSITIGLSLAALFVSFRSLSESRRVAQVTEHYDVITAADNMLGSDPMLLRFHGIDSTDLFERYGLDAVSLAYLLQSFNAGSIEHLLDRRTRQEESVFKPGSYRYEFLSNPDTQKAFPLIERLFESTNSYMAKCRRTIESFPAKDCET